MQIIGGEVEIELHLRPFGGIIQVICKGVSDPVTVTNRIVDAYHDVSLGMGVGLALEAEFAADILVREGLVRIDVEAKTIFMDGVADADEILFRRATVGHDMEINPWCVPFLAVLEVVGIDLCLGRNRGNEGR